MCLLSYAAGTNISLMRAGGKRAPREGDRASRASLDTKLAGSEGVPRENIHVRCARSTPRPHRKIDVGGG